MEMLKGLAKLSKANQDKITEILREHLSQSNLGLLEAFFANPSRDTEPYQELNLELEVIFKQEQAVQYFLNNEKTIAHIIFGNRPPQQQKNF